MGSGTRDFLFLNLLQLLVLRAVFLDAMVSHDESMARVIVTIDVAALQAEGMTMEDCRQELEKYEGVVVHDQWEIGEHFQGFLISDPLDKRDEVSHVIYYYLRGGGVTRRAVVYVSLQMFSENVTLIFL